MMRASSISVRAGTSKLSFSATGSPTSTVRTASRNPSAAAIVSSSFSIVTSTPESTGRVSSVAAANATWLMAARSVRAGTWQRGPSPTLGTAGKSSASIPLMFAS